MSDFPSDEHVFPSTATRWKYVKIACPPEAIGTGRRRRSTFSLSLWPKRTPLTLKVSYRGGPECWYEIHTRGVVIRTPGHISLHDLMSMIYGEGMPGRRRGPNPDS